MNIPRASVSFACLLAIAATAALSACQYDIAKTSEEHKNVKDLTLKAASLNARQLALKMSGNSLYGFCGFGAGKLPERNVAILFFQNHP